MENVYIEMQAQNITQEKHLWVSHNRKLRCLNVHVVMFIAV